MQLCLWDVVDQNSGKDIENEVWQNVERVESHIRVVNHVFVKNCKFSD